MRRLILLVWLLVPALVGAYHYGPGQQRLVLDRVADLVAQADRDAAQERWQPAADAYAQALELLPGDRVAQQQRLRLERAKAQMWIAQLPQAHQELKQLVQELQDDPAADPQLLNEARGVLANSQYYMTWLMRLEGQPRAIWEPEIEAARQTCRLLAEEAVQRDDAAAATRHQHDLEAVIRLARLDLSDLQGLPLPSQ